MSKTNRTAAPEITAEMARQVLADNDKRAGQAFLDEFRELCQRHGAELIATAFIMPDGRIGADISHFSMNGRVMEIGRHG